MTEDLDAIRRQLRITCADAVELVTDFLEEALVAGDRERMEAHLAGCEACAVFVDQVRSTVSLVGATRRDDFDLDAGTVESLVQAWRTRETTTPPSG